MLDKGFIKDLTKQIVESKVNGVIYQYDTNFSDVFVNVETQLREQYGDDVELVEEGLVNTLLQKFKSKSNDIEKTQFVFYEKGKEWYLIAKYDNKGDYLEKKPGKNPTSHFFSNNQECEAFISNIEEDGFKKSEKYKMKVFLSSFFNEENLKPFVTAALIGAGVAISGMIFSVLIGLYFPEIKVPQFAASPERISDLNKISSDLSLMQFIISLGTVLGVKAGSAGWMKLKKK